MLTVGGAFIDNIDQNQEASYLNPPATVFTTNRSSTQHALYGQDELKLAPWLIFNGGARYDNYQNFWRVTPRAALIALPTQSQSLKYLYGRAFRAPNEYELNAFYFGAKTEQLRPETIDTHEWVWERYTNDWLRTSASTYWYKADHLITQVADDSTLLGLTFVNQRQVRARGLELEAQIRLTGGLQGVASYAFQHSHDEDSGLDLVNSPHHMVKLRTSAAGPFDKSVLSMELLMIGSRRTLAGNTVSPAVTADVTMVTPLGRSLELTGSVRNLFDRDYSDPASAAHLQDSLPQNGRTFRVGVRWNWTPKPGAATGTP
jgi:iron complex outermembrane receptor protein